MVSDYYAGPIDVNYGSVQAAKDDIGKSIGEVQHWLNDLDSSFKQLNGNGWEGSQAQQAYIEAKRKWDGEIGQMLTKLGTLGTKAVDAAEGIANADKKAAGGFT